MKRDCSTCVYTDSPCVLSDYPSKDGICSHYKNVFEENAELKERNRELLESCEGATMMYKDLCKAKTYLKYFIEILKRLKANKEPLVIEAEQFISEVEK